MKKYSFFLSALLVASLLVGCGSNSSSNTTSEGTTSETENLEIRQLADLTEEIKLSETDEDVQVFTTKIGNDPDKSHLTVSFPITRHDFINDHERDFSQLFVDEFKNEVERLGGDAIGAIDFNQHFEIKYKSEELLVLLYARSTSLGNNYEDKFYCSTYDLKGRRRLTTADLFDSQEAFEGFASEIRGMAEHAVRERLEQSGSYANNEELEILWQEMKLDIEEGTKPNVENYKTVFFDESKHWYVIFDKYQIASGAMGSFTIQIPQSVMDKYLGQRFASLFRQSRHEAEQPRPKTVPKPKRAAASEASSDAPCVALTFDDGPSIYTARLLDILKSEDVKATFFVLGKSAAVQQQTMRRMFDEGHNVGNHSYDHKNFAKISLEEAQEQIKRTDEITERITGERPTYFRFPYGAFTKEKLPLVGRPIMGWSVDPLDWKYRDASKVASEMSKASAHAIILAHDIHKSTVDAIPEVIRNLKAKGYRIVTLDELFAGKQLKDNQVYTSGR